MIGHLSAPILNALADGELTPDQWSATNKHLAECASCASDALFQSQLKAATAKAGMRYTPPPGLQERVLKQVRHERSAEAPTRRASASSAWTGLGFYGWASACALLIVSVAVFTIQKNARQDAVLSAEKAAIVTEAYDQHVAALASSGPPQVISSDRHSVKPWFQGKLPFSFNLPDNLASGTALDGANLTYLHNRPAAQLLYSIGKHRASVYLEQRLPTEQPKNQTLERSGFHVIVFFTNEIHGVAVSDVEPARLSELVSKITQVQNK